MFVQIVQGRVREPEAAQRLLEGWEDEVGPATEGFLGSTAGVTDDGWLVHIARFRGQGDAGRHSAQPEQNAWWNELRALFSGEVSHHDCSDVALVGGGGDDAAARVEIVQKRSEPGQRLLHGSIGALEAALERHRPDVLGALLACGEDGTITQVVYLSDDEGASPADAPPAAGEEAALLRHLGAEPGTDDRTYELRSPVLVAA